MSKFLLVDDDVQLGTLLSETFRNRGLNLELALSGEDALQLLENFDFDLVLLDWNMPGMNGLELCKRYRKNKGRAYIIFLTGESDIDSKEQALDAGGDDFITKPFDVREVFARIKTVMRRLPAPVDDNVVINGVTLEPESNTLKAGENKIQLTPSESALLEYLMRHPNRPFNAQRLLETVWPSGSETSVESVRTRMKKLRQKLAVCGKPDFIKTVSGGGYVIEGEA